MPRTTHKALPDDLEIDPKLKAAINEQFGAVYSRIDEIRKGQETLANGQLALGIQFAEMHAAFDAMGADFRQNSDVNRTLTRDLRVILDRRAVEQREASDRATPLPPMRGRADTMSAIEELREAATSHKPIPSDRVEALIENVLGKRDLKKYERAADTAQRIRMQIFVSVASAVIFAALTFLAGHWEGRSSAPVQQSTVPQR